MMLPHLNAALGRGDFRPGIVVVMTSTPVRTRLISGVQHPRHYSRSCHDSLNFERKKTETANTFFLDLFERIILVSCRIISDLFERIILNFWDFVQVFERVILDFLQDYLGFV
jgi:hypothetical protein